MIRFNKLAAKSFITLAKRSFSCSRNLSNSCNEKEPPKIEVPYLNQNDCRKIPAIGLGTYSSRGCECEQAVADAIDLGYRHIDSAHVYENEKEVGAAIRKKICDGVITRDDIYVVTKLWCHFHEGDKVEYAYKKALTNFGLDYMDLYLLHWPFSFEHRGDDVLMPKDCNGKILLSDVDYLETWCAMEKLVENGMVKSIGVSNFNSEQLARLLSNCTIKPTHNQVECHPGFNQKELIELCKGYDILVTAYCPLGRPNPEEKTPDFIYGEKTQKIAEKYKKTPAQVVLRYLIEKGTTPIPKSVNKERMAENLNVFDFELCPEDHEVLNSFHTGCRIIPMDIAEKSPNYPFNIKF